MIDALFFDMDGTIADLYNVQDWESKLRNNDFSVYADAKPLVDLTELRDIIRTLKQVNITVGIISWSSKTATKKDNLRIKKIKSDWLKHYQLSFDEVHVIKYGTPKKKASKAKNAVLVDDNAQVRQQWRGLTIDANNPKDTLNNIRHFLCSLDLG